MSRDTLELFDGADFGRPNFVSLKRARDLVADVCDLENVIDESFYDRCEVVRLRALTLGAHSVARAVTWCGSFKSHERYGFDHVHITTERAARRWLKRQEEARLS